MTESPARRPLKSVGAWSALVLVAAGVVLFAEGRLLRGPAVVVSGILVWLLFRERSRKTLVFAAVTVVLATLTPIVAVFGLDLYLHHRYAATGGYNVWGYRGQWLGRKRPGERRIAVLGGSTAFGYGVKTDESYPFYLERTLGERERDTGRGPITVANLGWNGEGAYSFRFTLEDYDYLNPDLVLLYSGYNDWSRNRVVFRRQSAIFRQTGYLPILPVVSGEWLRRTDLGGVPAEADGKVVFQPHLADRSASQAADLARGITQALERELQRLSSTETGTVHTTPSGVDCGRWNEYCHALADAVRYALDRGRHVVVVTEPSIAGGGALADVQFDQQHTIRSMLAEQFAAEPRLHYLNMGRAVNLTDTTLCYDGMHLTARGNARLASRLADGLQPILIEMSRGAGETAGVHAAAAPPPLEILDRIPPTLLATGRYEAAREEAGKAVLQQPADKRASDELAEAELRLGRVTEARNVLGGQITSHIDDVWTHRTLYLIAASTGDRALVEREIAWGDRSPDRFVMLSAQADVAAAGGRLAMARQLRDRAIAAAQRSGRDEAAAVMMARQAIAELMAGNTGRALDGVLAAVAMSRRPGLLWTGALVHALAGRPDEAAALAEAFKTAAPHDVMVEKLWAPVLSGSILLGRGDPQHAIDLLESTVAYERGTYWPRYLRGLSHLKMNSGFQAALEFSGILAQPGLAATDIVYPIAERQLARARAVQGAAAILGPVYGTFFESWRYADRDLPVVRETAAEYLELRRSISLPPLPEGPWQ